MTTHQRGYVKPTGTRVKMWRGHYQRKVDGEWIAATKILGPRATMSKQEAKDALAIHIQGEKPTYGKGATFTEAATRYLALKQGDWGKQTRINMASIFQKHIVPALGGTRASDIVSSDCKALFNSVASSESLLGKVVTHTRAVFDMLLDDEMITRNPAKGKTVSLPKTPKTCGRYLTLDEARRLLAAATDRDRLILWIMMACALRPSEVFALRIDDIEPGRLRIDEAFTSASGLKATKTEESFGYVPISATLEAALRRYARILPVADSTAFLFPNENGTPMCPNNYLKRHLYPIAARAGLKRVTLQCLRRTTGTNMQHHGAVKSTQGLLRHADAKTTLKHYQKTIPADVVDAANSWDKELMG